MKKNKLCYNYILWHSQCDNSLLCSSTNKLSPMSLCGWQLQMQKSGCVLVRTPAPSLRSNQHSPAWTVSRSSFSQTLWRTLVGLVGSWRARPQPLRRVVLARMASMILPPTTRPILPGGSQRTHQDVARPLLSTCSFLHFCRSHRC